MRIEEATAIHERLLANRRSHRQAEHQLAVLLADLADRRLYAELGYASVFDYADRVLDLPVRQARDLIRIGRHLCDLPVLAAALADGQLGWTKAREIVSVATPETEAAWVARATTVPSRELEKQVACAKTGGLPPDAATEPERGPERRRVVLDMQSADLEVLRQALGLMRSQMGLDAAEVEDGVLVAELARQFLHHQSEPSDPATGERYRFVILDTAEGGDPRGVVHDVSDTVVAEAACDAEVIDMRPGSAQGRSSRVIAPVLRKKLLNRAQWRCEVPECCSLLWLDVHHLRARADGGDNQPQNLVVVCSGHHRAIHAGGLALERGVGDRMVVTHRNGDSRQGLARPTL
ncbi:hypothetical protein LBMAG42_37290 [Deltaproteobacteria bacterium]|nr:hypothetical protein LBMAG42_37290 [Deltaproteobacteria bacterium]